MPLWRHLVHGVRSLVRPTTVDREISDEVRDYLERATADHEARGLSLDDARRAARLELGSLASTEEHVRSYGWQHVVETTVADVRYAWRGLRGSPGFAAAVILTLALGLGAVTTIASAVRPILLEPVPYPDAARVAIIWEIDSTGRRIDGTFGMYRWLLERSRAFASIAVTRPWLATITGVDEPERIHAASVTAGYFDVLGVPPAIGRSFSVDDDRANGPQVAVIGDRVWRRRFDADPQIVGRTLSLDNRPYTVVGIMPAAFEDALAPDAEIWTPLQYDLSQGRAWGHHLRTVGRVRPDVTLDQASTEIDALGREAIATLKPETYGQNMSFAAVALGDELTRDIRPALVAMIAAVSLLLVIGCVNVTNLLLARGVRRRGEFALRTALGAGRSRLIRTLLTESLMLAGAGGAAGLAVAALGVRAVTQLGLATVPRIDAVRLDTGIYLFALGVVTIVGIGVGLVPARVLARTDPRDGLAHASRGQTSGHHRLRRALVAIEVALALILLVASGLLFRSLERL
ncbi:MAG TPA: ABC transporter permease, partial [Vicinamibacterales bacterium]|nr:ABC transporter permease [Vicinamibacterales bacterium]